MKQSFHLVSTKDIFKRFRFSPKIILSVLTLYFASSSSLRAIQKILFSLLSIKVSHVTIHKWTKHFAILLEQISGVLLSLADLKSDEWHADETIVKISGIKHYLWVLLDSETRVIISFFLSPYRDSNSAFQLCQRALFSTSDAPDIIVTDRLDSYNMPISVCYPSTKHYPYKGFKDYLNNNFIESFNNTFKSWYKVKKGFKSFKSANALITTFIFYYNFIHHHSSLNNLSPALVAGVKYSNQDALNWFLI